MEDINENKPGPIALSSEQAMYLAEAVGIQDNFSLIRYYAIRNNEIPSVLHYSASNIEAIILLQKLKKNMNAQVIHSSRNKYGQHYKTTVRYTVSFPAHSGYLLHAMNIMPDSGNKYNLPDSIPKIEGSSYSPVYLSSFQLLHPSDSSGKRDITFEQELDTLIDQHIIYKKPEKPTIYMIEIDNGGKWYLQSHAVSDDFEMKNLDVNYGYGFEKFHNELMHRFNTETKGLVLFHGEPGTGKTFYIRHLLRKMASHYKIVIYMPPNMVDHLVEPGFMTFLTNELTHWADEGFFCVLLIEDAEPLLAKRQQGDRIQGVTNLLNMTDGLLNDMLNLQIICTFNVDLKRLDKALLRPGRLIARKEFKPLSELDANLLAQRLGIKHHFTAPATLGEIYSKLKNKNTLIHDVEPDKDASTLIDDL